MTTYSDTIPSHSTTRPPPKTQVAADFASKSPRARAAAIRIIGMEISAAVREPRPDHQEGGREVERRPRPEGDVVVREAVPMDRGGQAEQRGESRDWREADLHLVPPLRQDHAQEEVDPTHVGGPEHH